MAQQNSGQAMNQSPMQQPTQQSYQKAMVPAGTPVAVPNNWNLQMQYSQASPGIQGQIATNRATTTTTTTTTKKISKLKQALQGRKEPSASSSSNTTDFSSLYQQPPQQQRQTATDYSQLMRPAPSSPPPQPQPQSTVDFSQLMQSAPPPPPPTQQTTNFPQLMQAAPQPQPAQSPRANQGASSPSNTQSTTISTTTETVGSASRQQAPTLGAESLRRFDQNVSIQLKRMVGGPSCPMGFDFYAVREGYLCGGGHHFVDHGDVEAMLKHGRCPRLEIVNGPGERGVTPPPGEGDGSGAEPAFWTADEQLRHGLYPFARLRNPRWNPRLNGGRRGRQDLQRQG